MADETRDPEQALEDIGDDVAEGEAPSAEERDFLEGENVGREDRGEEGGGLVTG